MRLHDATQSAQTLLRKELRVKYHEVRVQLEKPENNLDHNSEQNESNKYN